MAVGAITLRARVLNFRGLDVLCLLIVTGDAKCLRIFFRQHDPSVLSRFVAGRARILVRERRVYEFVLELRSLRFVRIVTSQTIGLFEWLIIVRLLEVGTRHVVAIETQSRSGLREVVIEFAFAYFPGLVRDVTSAATHVERCMTASALGHIYTNLMAAQTEILIFVFAFCGLQ